jgi:hypothetical protein
MTRRDVLAALAALGLTACSGRSKLAGGRRAAAERTLMRIGNIYATGDGESHIGDLDIFLDQNPDRPLFFNSKRIPASTVAFQHVKAGGATARHTAPHPWLAFILIGTWEIESSDGTRRQFPAGSVVLVEDTTGKGHRGWAVGDRDVLVAAVALPAEAIIV